MRFSAEDVQQLVDYCQANLDLTTLVHAEEYGYANLPLCIIDCVFSIGVRYEAVRNTIRRFCDYTRVNGRVPGASANYTVTDLVGIYQNKPLEDVVSEVYKNRQRTSSRGGILKAEAVFQVAEVLLALDVNSLADFESVAGTPQFEAAFLKIPGQRSGVSLRYFYMLTGSVDHIKPDRMILRFIQSALGRTATLDESHQLLLESCRILEVQYPELNPRTLDHQIWLFQRNQPT
jgi:hypothetical protein